MKTVVFQLSSGYDIVGLTDLDHEKGVFKVQDAMIVTLTANPPGPPMLSLHRYNFFDSKHETVTFIRPRDVISFYEASEAFHTYYRSQYKQHSPKTTEQSLNEETFYEELQSNPVLQALMDMPTGRSIN